MTRRIDAIVNEKLDEKGWTWYRLSKETGVRKATIQAIYNNEMRRYPADVLAKIADALEIDDVNELLRIKRAEDDKE